MIQNGSLAAASDVDHLTAMPCPACGGHRARRAHRIGLAEEMLSVVYVYPFRCRLCTHRFLALQWGVRYQRIFQDSESPRHAGRWTTSSLPSL